MAGEVSVSLEREPDGALAATIEGDVHRTIVARDTENGRIAALGSVAVRDAYVNGRVERLGYLGQLRVHRTYRNRPSILLGGYQFLRDIHAALGAKLYLTSIFADNIPARRFLERRLPGMPTYRPVETFETVLMPVTARWQDQGPADPRLAAQESTGRTEPRPPEGVVACLTRNGPRFQFAPVWSDRDFDSVRRTRGLCRDDFVYSTDEGGTVIGCLAVWDQRSYKQAVVRGYSRRLARWRPCINLVAPLLGRGTLPSVGERLDLGYVSHVAIDGDDPDVFARLLTAAHESAARRGMKYLVIGFSTRNPLLAVSKRLFRHRSTMSKLYAVHWDDGAEVAESLDGRIAHYEVALL